MTTRKTYHVVPVNGGWRVRKEGLRTGRIYDRKSEAVEKARDAARNATRGAVVVHDKRGRFQTEHTYAVIDRVRSAFSKTAKSEMRSLPRDGAAKHDKYIYGKR